MAEALYAGVFGWGSADGVARLGGHAVAGIRPGYGAAWTSAIRVDDAVAATARALAAGAREVPGGLADPTGAMFALRERGGAELVNAARGAANRARAASTATVAVNAPQRLAQRARAASTGASARPAASPGSR